MKLKQKLRKISAIVYNHKTSTAIYKYTLQVNNKMLNNLN